MAWTASPTVLLVESVQDDRVMYAEYLRLDGFQPIEIDDTAGLALAATVDAVVTGVLVGGLFDGIELVRRLRRNEATRGKPVIVLTACVVERARQSAHDAGCDRFLIKPCLPETPAAAIRHALAQRAGPRSLYFIAE